MSSSSPTSTLNVDVQPGKPPMLRVDAPDDAPRWAAEHRDALRAVVVQHGSLLVRGLGLGDVAGTEAVFRQLGSLMTEREAFAPRRRRSEEHTSELQSLAYLVCRLLLEKKKNISIHRSTRLCDCT